jgi:hypothetical protein
MRIVLRPVLAIAAATALTLPVMQGSAAAASSASCPQAGSTRLFTGDVLGRPDTATKLWAYSAAGQTTVCFLFPDYPTPVGGGAVVATSGVSFAPPSVTPGTDPAACVAEVVDIVDPTALRIAYGATGTTVCLTVNDETTTLTFRGPSVTQVPSVEVWRDGTGGWFDFPFCAAQVANSAAYNTCLNTPGRVV